MRERHVPAGGRASRRALPRAISPSSARSRRATRGTGGEPVAPAGPGEGEDDRLRLSVAFDARRLTYTYDFGDDWVHEIRVTDTRQGEPGVGYPRYVAGERNGPPEDCGGVSGFYDLLDARADPHHKEHETAVTWLDDYDPDTFDELPIKYALGRIAATPKKPASQNQCPDPAVFAVGLRLGERARIAEACWLSAGLILAELQRHYSKDSCVVDFGARATEHPGGLKDRGEAEVACEGQSCVVRFGNVQRKRSRRLWVP